MQLGKGSGVTLDATEQLVSLRASFAWPTGLVAPQVPALPTHNPKP